MTDEPQWHVLHVRPRCEKKLAEHCGSRALECYLPLRTETKRYQRRRVVVEKPLFTGYVFAVFGPAERVEVLKSNLVVRVLDTPDQARLVRELAQVRRALEADPTLGACQAFTQGRAVRVTGGPFQGVEGVVQTVRGQTRVVLNVEMIGQAVAVEVDRDLVEVRD